MFQAVMEVSQKIVINILEPKLVYKFKAKTKVIDLYIGHLSDKVFLFYYAVSSPTIMCSRNFMTKFLSRFKPRLRTTEEKRIAVDAEAEEEGIGRGYVPCHQAQRLHQEQQTHAR